MSNYCAASRYASEEMEKLFSYEYRAQLWRQLWVYLAEAQQELGLSISEEQIEQMRAKVEDIPRDRIRELEEQTRHEVMAHVHAFAEQCPKAEPIIHLGATSMYVMDNADLIRVKEALSRIQKQLTAIVEAFSQFCEAHIDTPVVGLTHLQTAQVTTVGKRASLWLSEFLQDLRQVQALLEELPFRSVKGAVGTQSSFLELFDGSYEDVQKLEKKISARAGFSRTVSVSGQTYSRKIDSRILQGLSQIAQSAGKYAVDMRLLQSRGEMQEPTGEDQVGSSAMPHKVNPIRTERITGLSRFVMENVGNGAHTASNQWLERSLDDSSNRRFSISHSFLVTDGLLRTVLNCARGMTVHEEQIREQLQQERPFLLSEYFLMKSVKEGKSRQKIHERLRKHARRTSDSTGEDTLSFLDRVRQDDVISSAFDEIPDPDWNQLAGCAKQQVRSFLDEEVYPTLEALPEVDMASSLDV